MIIRVDFKAKKMIERDDGPFEVLTPIQELRQHLNTCYHALRARFGDNQPRGGVIYKSPGALEGSNLILDTYGRGDVANAATTVDGTPTAILKRSGLWNAPMPFPASYSEIDCLLEFREVKSVTLGAKSDPFMWMDKKYEVTRYTLMRIKERGLKLTIRTRSDLIAHDDYTQAMDPANTTVIMLVNNPFNEEISRAEEPGAPSIKRRMQAVEKLRERGIKVEVQYTHKVAPKLPTSMFRY